MMFLVRTMYGPEDVDVFELQPPALRDSSGKLVGRVIRDPAGARHWFETNGFTVLEEVD